MTSPAHQPTPVTRLVAGILADSDPAPGTSDDEIAVRCDRLADKTASLARLAAVDWPEVECKLAVLTNRLRAEVSADDAEAVRTALLAESVRDDVRRLARLVLSVPLPHP